ncbi:MAG: hypothetical protein IPO27_05080 [Bacteroidetes bacterium]|nr:hypothetical protein [Bacteroidota bacterium]
MYSAFWHFIGDIFLFLFKPLPYIGVLTNWIFIFLTAFGCIYWMVYEAGVEKGKRNYLSEGNGN